jgi:hypothetical protein
MFGPFDCNECSLILSHFALSSVTFKLNVNIRCDVLLRNKAGLESHLIRFLWAKGANGLSRDCVRFDSFWSQAKSGALQVYANGR